MSLRRVSIRVFKSLFLSIYHSLSLFLANLLQVLNKPTNTTPVKVIVVSTLLLSLLATTPLHMHWHLTFTTVLVVLFLFACILVPTTVAERRGLIKQLTSNQVGSVYSIESTGVRASGSVRRSFEQGKGWLSLAIISSADPLGVSAFTGLVGGRGLS